MRIKKGDRAQIMKGKDRGKAGSVAHVNPTDGKVLIDGLNLAKKHVRPRKEGEKGQVIEIARPIAVANVKVVCPRCGKPSRIGFRMEGERKVRFCKSCSASIEK